MSSTIIVNAAPMYIALGTKDQSTRTLPRVPLATPTHFPKLWIYASKGPEEVVSCSGGERLSIFGDDTFDPLSKFCNHATILSNEFNSMGNQQRIKRIIPADAGPQPNLMLSIDIVEAEIDDYERNADGSIKMDVNDDPVVLGKIPGVKMKWVVTTRATKVAMQNFGQATITAGDMDNGDIADPVVSQRYPILEFKHSFIGANGNNAGIRLWSPDSNDNGSIDSRILTRQKFFPYRLQVIKRATQDSSPRVVENIFGGQYVDIALKPGAVFDGNSMYIGAAKSFLDRYQNLNDPTYPSQYGDFGQVAVYQNNIDTITNMIYALESVYHTDNGVAESDFTGATGEQYLTNIVGAATSSGYKYHTVAIESGVGSVALGEFTNLFAQSGSDGTMSDALFAAAVAADVAEYNNPNSSLLNDAIHDESIIYDSGFPMETKYALFNALGIRKDIFVAVTPFEAGGPRMTAIEENSAATALKARAQLFPESEFHGTEVCRAMIMGRNGLLRDSLWEARVPVLNEIGYKSARYMGASNGVWKNGFDFDGEDGARLTRMYDINVSFTPAAARNRDWSVGLNWVQDDDARSQFIPALKTVYSDDTSVLTSYVTVMGMIEANKVCQRAWRRFSGVTKYTRAQLAERVNEFVAAGLRDRFDGRFVFIPETYFTTADVARGFSWTVKVKMYANNMQTVMTFFVETYRREDLETTT